MRRRIKVNRLREILRLSLEGGFSQGAVAKALRVGKGTVRRVLQGFTASALPWPPSDDMSDSQLQDAIYGPVQQDQGPRLPTPDWEALERELRHPHVTMQLLYEEYRQGSPEHCLSRTRFYVHFTRYLQSRDLCLRMLRKGGDLLFVDFAGSTLPLYPVDAPATSLQLLLTSFGASGMSFAICLPSQAARHFLHGLTCALSYYDCAPQAIVPDNLKSAVIKARRYDPFLNAMFENFCQHYAIVPLPARVRKPKDKALVENAVRHLGDFILGRLRNEHLVDLQQANARVMELVEQFNSRLMKHYGRSRKERFELLDKPLAKPLPKEPFSLLDIQRELRVERDYHVRYQGHFFSIPHLLVGMRLEAHWRAELVEFYHDGHRVASHPMPMGDIGQVSTNAAHMPTHHRAIRFPERQVYVEAAQRIGPCFLTVLERQTQNPQHPELGRRHALRLLAMASQYGAKRAESACALAQSCELFHVRDIEAILKAGADVEQAPGGCPQPVEHTNLRGRQAFTLNPKKDPK